MRIQRLSSSLWYDTDSRQYLNEDAEPIQAPAPYMQERGAAPPPVSQPPPAQVGPPVPQRRRDLMGPPVPQRRRVLMGGPSPYEIGKEILVDVVLGLAGPASEAAAIKALPALGNVGSLGAALGRVGVQTAGTAAAGQAVAGDPIGGALVGLTGSGVGETGASVGRLAKETHIGGAKGMAQRFLNRVGEVVGLGKNYFPSSGKVPTDVTIMPDDFYKKVLEPVKEKVEKAWVPAESPVMESLIKNHRDVLPQSVLDRLKPYDEANAYIDKLHAPQPQTPAGQPPPPPDPMADAKYRENFRQVTPSFLFTTQPVGGFTFKEMNETAAALRNSGFSKSGEMRGGKLAPEEVQALHALREDMYKHIGTFDEGLAAQYKQANTHAHGVEAVTNMIDKSGFHKEAGPTAMSLQEAYLENKDAILQAFGPQVRDELLGIVSRGKGKLGPLDRPFGVRPHVLMGTNPLPKGHFSVLPPRLIGPPIKPDLKRLLKYGIPEALISQQTVVPEE